MSRGPGAVVANPGSLGWLGHAASALAERGLLRAYFTTLVTRPGRQATRGRLPGPLARELRRRECPQGLTRSQLRRVAFASEAAAVAVGRAGLPEWAWLPAARHRDVAFDRAVSRRLESTDSAAVLAWGASLRSLERARRLDIPTFLDYPIAHHAFAERTLQEEARLQPAYARTLHFHRNPARLNRRLDEELRRADRVLALTDFQARTFEEAGIGREKIVLNPFGVDLELFSPAPVGSRDDGCFRVLFVGALTQRKGLSYVVEAFERAAIPGSELVLLGHVVNMSRPWEGRPGIRHIPPLAPWEVASHYRRADAFVLPTLVEGLPRVILEAMACGVPVIVSENSGGRDVISDGEDGYVVPIRDPVAIAERLIQLHRHPDARLAMGQAARRRAEHFTWEAYGDRLAVALTAARG